MDWSKQIYMNNWIITVNEKNRKPTWIEKDALYSEIFAKKNRKNIFINVGESWTYGESLGGVKTGIRQYDLYSMMTLSFGPQVADALDADFYQYAIPGNANGNMFMEIERILEYVTSLEKYEKIYFAIQMTEPSREHGALDNFSDHKIFSMYKGRRPRMSFDQWLAEYDEIYLDILDHVLKKFDDFNIDAVVWKNFCKFQHRKEYKTFKVIEENWIQMSARNLGIRYEPTVFQSIGWFDDIYETEQRSIEFDLDWCNKEIDKITLSNKFISENRLHSNHPTAEGHALWAKNLIEKSGWDKTPQVPETSTDTFCILPWIHLYANPNGEVLPCCIADWKQPMGNFQEQSIEDIWNGERFKKLRVALMNGEKPSTCDQCWAHEEAGNTSNRQSRNHDFSDDIRLLGRTKPDGELLEMDFKYVDIRWSNICNFKCKTCSPTYSSTWAKALKKQQIYRLAGGESNDKLFEELKPSILSAKQYYFAGGEPLMMDKHYDTLDLMIENDNTDIRLDYNTNLSVLKYKDKNITDYWNKFTNVNVNISIDHYGKQGEFIREGMSWGNTVNNIFYIKEHSPHVNLTFNTVVSNMNILTLTEFLKVMEPLPVNFEEATLYNIVDPPQFRISNMPVNMLKDAGKKIEEYLKNLPEKRIKRELRSVLNTVNKAIDEKENK